MSQRVVDHIAEYFDKRGVEHYFGYIGGSLWPLLDGLNGCEATGIQAKHEAQAVHMADGYYRVTGDVAPVLATKGPGALNAASGVGNLMHDSTATTVLLGGVPTQHTDKGAFESLYYHQQEGIDDLYAEITKQTWDCQRPDRTVEFVDKAMNKATEGRPGPTAAVIPYDVQMTELDFEVPEPEEAQADTRAKPSAESLEEAADLITGVDKPLIVVGGGVRLSDGEDALMDFVEEYEVPFVTSHMAKGGFPESHELCLGPVGRSGWNCAANATRNADVVLAIGCRFTDTHTVGYRRGIIYNIPPTKVIHVDIDPDEIGRNVPVEVGIMSDAGSFVESFHEELAERDTSTLGADSWRDQIGEWKDDWWEYVEEDTPETGSPIHPHTLVYETDQAMASEDMLFVDIGDIIQYAEPFTTVEEKDTYFFNGGMLQMGWAAGASLGAKLARPDREVLTLMGDGAFMMSSYVVATAVEYDIPANWIIMNNYGPNIERKASDKLFDDLHPWTSFGTDDDLFNPDFVEMAEAQGAEGRKISANEDVRPTVEEALASDKPFVIDATVDRDVPTWFTEGLDRDYPSSWTEEADYL